ncbi:MAG TPA: nucleotidyltransferase family protein [Candidatus Acidoferrum sp.]|nr:nucleotidyltransferase family protein [Candidatus Acidoferrum sp.]
MNPAFSSFASAETHLLACCARTFVSPEMAARIRETAAAPLDWSSVLAQAQEHSILPLLARNLCLFAAGTVPADVAAQLDSGVLANAVRCLGQTSELVHVVDLLSSRGIRALPYKGPVIAAQAYQDISARQFEDIDVIVQQRDVPAADTLVRSLGYQPRSAWLHSSNGRTVVPGEYSYSHPARRILLELHTEGTLRHFPVRAPISEFFAHAATVDLGGKAVQTFCGEDALPVYCIHATKDFWQKLIWVVDIAEMLRTFSNLDWDSMWRASDRLRARRMVHLGLALASGILDTPLPSDVQKRVEEDSHASSLAMQIAQRLLRPTAPAQQQTARERFLYRRQSVSGFVAGWRYALRLTLASAGDDWAQGRVPHPSSPLHAALRPFRLLRKYSR